MGLLIQVVPGRVRIFGSFDVVKRSGCAERAVAKTAERSLVVAAARP